VSTLVFRLLVHVFVAHNIGYKVRDKRILFPPLDLIAAFIGKKESLNCIYIWFTWFTHRNIYFVYCSSSEKI
jgi:hypothetical protein